MADGYNIKRGNTTSTVENGFPYLKSQEMILNHLRAKEEYEQLKIEKQYQHEKDLADKKNERIKDTLNINLGWVGRFFGGNKNISHNIVAILISLLLLFDIISSVGIYCWGKEIDESKLDLIKIIWGESAPLITLALGYIFGKKSNSE